MSTERKCHRWTHISVNVLLPVFLLRFHHCGRILHSEAPNLFLFSCHNPAEPSHPETCLIFADLKQENQSDIIKHLVNPPVGLSAFVEVRFYDDCSAAVCLYGDQQTFVLFLAKSEKAKAQKRQMSHSLALKWNIQLTLLKFINKMCDTIYHIYLLKRSPHSPSRHIRRSKIDSVGMLILFGGTQICHDVHCLHDVIHHMSVPHKLFCGLPVDDLCLRDTTISATNTRWFFIIKKIQKLQTTPVNALIAFWRTL